MCTTRPRRFNDLLGKILGVQGHFLGAQLYGDVGDLVEGDQDVPLVDVLNVDLAVKFLGGIDGRLADLNGIPLLRVVFRIILIDQSGEDQVGFQNGKGFSCNGFRSQKVVHRIGFLS